MKLTSLLFIVALTAGSLARANDAEDLLSLKEVALAQERTDGYFDVVCANGNREKISTSDIRANDVCPNGRSSVSTNMQSVQKRSDGLFDIVCRDQTTALVSSQQILNNDVCNQTATPVVIEDGVYESPGRANFAIRAKHSGQRLLSLRAEVSNLKADLNCYDNICSGNFPGYSQTFYFKVLSRKSFELSYGNREGVTVFAKME